jgi:acyl-CoA thioesterase
MPMDERTRQAFFRQVKKEPFAIKFGLELLELDLGYSRVGMTFTEDMKNFLGIAHGGALFALIDEAFETASNSHGTVAVALNMTVSYHANPAVGIRLVAEAKEFALTKRTAHYDIEVYDSNDKLIASCTALVYRKQEPLPFLK